MKGFLIVISILILISAPAITHAALALDVTQVNTTAPTDGAYTLGWRFDVHTPIKVNALGFWDASPDGVLIHLVSLWDIDGIDPLATASVDNNSTPVASQAQTGRWLLEDINPIILDPGRYVIGVFYYTFSILDEVIYNGQTTTIPEITYLQGTWGEGNAKPTFSYTALSYFGPTFDASAVPIPGSIWLFGAGLMGLIWIRKIICN